MTTTDQPHQLQASIEIDAPPAQVWALVTDLARMPRWSPMTKATRVLGGTVHRGAWFVNLNGSGPKRWPSSGRVVRFTPHSDFAFRITENRTVWAYQLEPTPTGGTLLSSRRETPDGISALSTVLTRTVLGGVPGFDEELRAGMHRTLEQIKADAER